MKKTTLCLLASAASLAAGELTPNQIPASAKWLLHGDIEGMRASETGKAVFQRIEADHGAKLVALKRMFSLHLLNDLSDVTLFGDGKKDHAVVLFDGNFNRAHIQDVVKAADEYSEAAYEGYTIHSWKDKNKTQHAAFASDKLLVFSLQENLLREELDVLKANAPASENPILPAAGSKPLIVAGAKLADIELPNDAARILRTAEVLTLSAHENDGRFAIQLDAKTADSVHANRMRRMLDGVAAITEARNPKIAESGLQWNLTATDKPGVSASLSLPVRNWLSFLKKQVDKQKGH
jgi:hypothetical protein